MKVLFWPGWWYPGRSSPLSGIFVQRHAEAVSLFCDTAVLFIVPDPGLGEKLKKICMSQEFISGRSRQYR
jgi:hypothetical protein